MADLNIYILNYDQMLKQPMKQIKLVEKLYQSSDAHVEELIGLGRYF